MTPEPVMADTATQATLSDPTAALLEAAGILPGQAEAVEVPEDPALVKLREERRGILGGTDIAAILGLDPYRSSWDVAAEKKGLVPSFEGNERTLWGQLLEEPIARQYAARENVHVRRWPGRLVRHPKYPFLGGHPDRQVTGPGGGGARQRKGLEIKTDDRRDAKERWSEPGEPVKVPETYYIQSEHYMLVTGYVEWDLAALFGLRRMVVYPFHANPNVQRVILERAQEFWERFILGADMPPMAPTDRAKEYLRRVAPANTGPMLDVATLKDPAAVEGWARSLHEASRQAKRWVAEEEKLKAHIKGVLLSGEGIIGTGWQVTWRKASDHIEQRTDWEAVTAAICEEHGIAVPAEMIVQHTRPVVTKAGPRVFRMKWDNEEGQ